MAQQFCSKCNRTMADTNFYTYKDGTKCELCKACLTMHINNFDPDTFLWILEKFDIPWLPWEWNILRDRAYQKDPYKMNGMSVFGKYLSKMKLKQWVNPETGKYYGWADTEKLQFKHENEIKAAGGSVEQAKAKIERMKEAFENGEISEAQYQTYVEINAPEPKVEVPSSAEVTNGGNSPYPVNSNFEEVELVDVGADLTQEDKIYLAMKWGRLYHADQWVRLEQLYNEFMNSFDIQGAARLDTLKHICKTSLKMSEAIDCGDVDTYQKLSRVYDSLMKSAKFTEAQNKEGKSDFVDSVGQLVAYCEKEGGKIPKFEIKADHDIVDTVVRDLKSYNKSLIYEDKSLAQEIEQYLRNREIAEQMKRDRAEARLNNLDEVELNDNDYKKYKEAIQSDIEEDESQLYNTEE